MKKRVIAIGSDHAGVEMKDFVIKCLQDLGHTAHDVGPEAGVRVDYPDYAEKVARAIQTGASQEGILICGTGIGMSIAANKMDGIRAALVHDPFTAQMARVHNNANILVVGARLMAAHYAWECIQQWLTLDFEERHQTRLNKISGLERSH